MEIVLNNLSAIFTIVILRSVAFLNIPYSSS